MKTTIKLYNDGCDFCTVPDKDNEDDYPDEVLCVEGVEDITNRSFDSRKTYNFHISNEPVRGYRKMEVLKDCGGDWHWHTYYDDKGEFSGDFYHPARDLLSKLFPRTKTDTRKTVYFLIKPVSK